MPAVDETRQSAVDSGRSPPPRCQPCATESPPRPAAERTCRTIFRSRSRRADCRTTSAGDDQSWTESPHQIQTQRRLVLPPSRCHFLHVLQQHLTPQQIPTDANSRCRSRSSSSGANSNSSSSVLTLFFLYCYSVAEWLACRTQA